jgi:hypothetical protein
MSRCPTSSEAPDGSSLPSSNATLSTWCVLSGRPIAEIARELGIYDSTLGNWVRQDAIDRGEREGPSSDEHARLHELERDNARLRMSVTC